MRKRAVPSLAIFLLAAGVLPAVPDRPEKKNRLRDETAKLQGRWALVSLETYGRTVSESILRRQGIWLTIQGNSYKFHRGKRTYPMIFRINPAQNPKTIDLTLEYGRSKGKAVLGIYELSENTLKVCQAPVGQARPTEFASKVSPRVVVYTFQRDNQR
jgi:uncharacterized protein (TIGR03067 family)